MNRLSMHEDASSQMQNAVRGLIDGRTSTSLPLDVVPVEAKSFQVKIQTQESAQKMQRAKFFIFLLRNLKQRGSTTKGAIEVWENYFNLLFRSIEGLEAGKRLMALEEKQHKQHSNCTPSRRALYSPVVTRYVISRLLAASSTLSSERANRWQVGAESLLRLFSHTQSRPSLNCSIFGRINPARSR
jgi:hypothetical protein